MKKLKIFALSFAFVYILTALLCIIFGHPLIYSPVDYSFQGFKSLALLLGILVFCLVYINFPVLNKIKARFFKRANNFVFFLIGSLLVLQAVTMLTGYAESFSARGVEADILYFYKCVGNSCIYILTGNITVVIACWLVVKPFR